MKTLSVAFTFSLFLLAGSSYARTTDPTVPESINTEFSHDFAQARHAKWEVEDKFFKVSFDVRGKALFAYYADNSDFIGVASNLLPDRLPRNLSAEIKSDYAGYWITDLIKYRSVDEHGFLITLENADKTVMLKSVGDRSWEVYRVERKS